MHCTKRQLNKHTRTRTRKHTADAHTLFLLTLLHTPSMRAQHETRYENDKSEHYGWYVRVSTTLKVK